MRLIPSTVCCLALAVGVAGADVPASRPLPPVPRPPTATLATTVRVFPASAGMSHPARIQVKVPRATLQALLQRAEHDDARPTDPAAVARVTAGDEPPRSTRTLRTVVAAVALALAVLLVPTLRRHRRRAGLAVALLVLAAAYSARADIAAPPGLGRGGSDTRPTPARGATQPTPATLELVVTDDGSSGILLTHASPR